MRNSLIPIATLLGLSIPGIFAGALITESVFNYPGMGYLFFQSAQKQDYPVLLGFIVVVAIATVVGSLLADIALRGPRPEGEVRMTATAAPSAPGTPGAPQGAPAALPATKPRGMFRARARGVPGEQARGRRRGRAGG